MTRSPNMPEPATSLEVRAALVRALRLDLIGPGPEGEHAEESLPGRERPSLWYLTGFLVPTGTPVSDRADDEEDDDAVRSGVCAPESPGRVHQDPLPALEENWEELPEPVRVLVVV